MLETSRGAPNSSPSIANYPFDELLVEACGGYYVFEDTPKEGEPRLCPLSKVNVFVGANNSGKSRLMRALAGISNLRISQNLTKRPGEITIPDIRDKFEKFKSEAIGILALNRCHDVNNVRDELERLTLPEMLVEGGDDFNDSFEIIQKLSLENQVRSSNGGDSREAVVGIQNLAQKLKEELGIKGNAKDFLPITKKLYVPTLRSLRDLGAEDEFGKRTKADYFSNASHVEVFTGRTLYADVERLVRGNLSERDLLRKFEIWISETFFRGEAVAIIPRMGQTSLTIKIGDEAEQPIHNLGDGIQAILVLAFPLFVRGDAPLLAFIEEPELFLHPWLQRVLLEMLSKRFPKHQYFLTTHSNHFLDLTLDVESVSVFTFEKILGTEDHREKNARYTVRNVSGGSRKPLELLGVRNSSVLLTNCTIWVEGITDRRYLAHWLNLYQKAVRGGDSKNQAKFFKEDLHYSFVEYSGGNITHWSFLDESGPDVDRLCGRLFLVADKDEASATSQKGKRHAALSAKLGERFHLLPVREIENLLTPEIIRTILEKYGEDPQNLRTPKQESYKIQLLGGFIEAKFLIDASLKVRVGSYAADSGTVADKVRFCDHAISAMASFGDLSPDARDLTERVYTFIQTNN